MFLLYNIHFRLIIDWFVSCKFYLGFLGRLWDLSEIFIFHIFKLLINRKMLLKTLWDVQDILGNHSDTKTMKFMFVFQRIAFNAYSFIWFLLMLTESCRFFCAIHKTRNHQTNGASIYIYVRFLPSCVENSSSSMWWIKLLIFDSCNIIGSSYSWWSMKND